MNLVEKLLSLDKQKVLEKKTETYESKRMKELVGDPEIKIMELDQERLSELNGMLFNAKGNFQASKTYQAALNVAAEGIVSPDLKDEKLKEHFGVHTAAELAKVLFKGEIIDISDAIQELSNGEALEEEEIKN